MTNFNKRKPERASILLIYTGGTIGMKEDPADGTLKPFDFEQIRAQDRLLHFRSSHRLFGRGAGTLAVLVLSHKGKI